MLRIFALVCLLAATPAAQVRFTGVLTRSAPSATCPEGGFTLAHVDARQADVRLASSALELDDYLGVNAVFTADASSAKCASWEITSVDVQPSAALSTCGNAVPGCPVRLRIGPPDQLGQYLLFFSLAPDFAPLDPSLGTLLLRGPTLLTGGATFGTEGAVDLVVPTHPVLTGTSFWFQAARRDVAPVGSWAMTNAIRVTVLPETAACSDSDC